MTKVGVHNIACNLSNDEWLDALLNQRLKYNLPDLPAHDIQEKYNGRSGVSVFEAALPTYKAFLKYANELGFVINPESILMDFGCGWGRFSQIALRDFKDANIYSVDVDPNAIDICKKTGLTTNLVVFDKYNSLPFPDDTFDIIISNSVFSHLSEELSMHYFNQFSKVLKKNGVLAVTTRSRSFIEYVVKLKERYNEEIPPPFIAPILSSFKEPLDMLRLYDNGEFVFEPIGSGVTLGKDYGEAFIPRKYVERSLTSIFSSVNFIDVHEEEGLEQAIIFAQK